MRRALVHALYLGLSLLFASRFFPLTHPTSFAISEGDPAIMCWALQWVSHAIAHDPAHLFAGNMFFPYQHAVVMSDSMLSLAILNAPVRFFTANPWVGYNLLIVLAYYLSCVWGAWLARELTGSDVASVWAGVFWGFLFFRVHHIGHLQILSYQAIPAVAAASLRFWRQPATKSALLVALLFLAQALVSWYLAFIEAVIVIVIALCQPWKVVFTRRTAVYYALIAAIVVAVLTPVALPYRSAFADSTLSERYSLVNSFGDAVHLADYLTPPSATLAGSLIANNRYWIWGENTLYVGYVPLMLSFAGLVVSALRRTPARAGPYVGTGIALVVVGYVFSLGFVSPSLHIPLPLHYLARVVPSVAGLRATQRFALVIYMGILMLSTSGFVALTRGWTAQPSDVGVRGCLRAVSLGSISIHVAHSRRHAVRRQRARSRHRGVSARTRDAVRRAASANPLFHRALSDLRGDLHGRFDHALGEHRQRVQRRRASGVSRADDDAE